jgi:hypothetical protein
MSAETIPYCYFDTEDHKKFHPGVWMQEEKLVQIQGMQ